MNKSVLLTVLLICSFFTISQEIPNERFQAKKEKRYINPRSIFLGGGFGLFEATNFTNSSDFENEGFASWSANAKIELGLKSNFFAEISIGAEQYFQVIIPTTGFGAGSNAFVAGKLSLGAGYRFIHPKSNLNFFNVRIGYAGSFQNRIGNTGSGGGTSWSSQSYFEYHSFEQGNKSIFPTFYCGIDKDIRLFKNGYLSLGYRFDHGFTHVYETRGLYRTSPTADYDSFYYKITGTGHTFNLSFKYKLGAT